MPYFDPYSTSIVKVDQWVRISCLPWEFWVEQTLTNLLKPSGEVIRIDHNTLFRKKKVVLLGFMLTLITLNPFQALCLFLPL